MSLARNSIFFPFSTINYRHDRPTKISQKIARSHKITSMFRPKRFTLKSYKRLYFVCKNLNLLAYKVYLIVETCHRHPGQNGNPSDGFDLQSAEAARSGGDLVFSVPLKGCEVINTFTFFDIIVTFTFFHIIVTFFDIIITFTFFDIIITSFIITLVFSVPIKCYDQHFREAIL